MYTLKWIQDPNFTCYIFRMTTAQIDNGLWDNYKDMVDPLLRYQKGVNKGRFKGKAKISERKREVHFPTGAKVIFKHVGNFNELKQNIMGLEASLIMMDEFGHLDQASFLYMLTRMRSKAKCKSMFRASLNPEPQHHCLKFLSRYINQDTGYAIEELSGKKAYYISVDGEIKTAWDKEELLESYPTKRPLAYTFIPSKMTDNPAMLEVNPDYEDQVAATGKANAEMLIMGNWFYKPEANGLFSKELIQEVPLNQVPPHLTYVRAWDKAAKKPAKEGGDSKTLDPDYTASIKMGRDTDGNIYIFGDYAREPDGSQRMRFRENPGERENLIAQQAYVDGYDISIVLPQDPGQGGIFEFQQSAKQLQSLGFTVMPDPSPSNRGKAMRFEPFVAACYAKNVYWVRESFHPACWDYLVMELENFNGDKNNGYHDDVCDCFSTAFAAIVRKQVIYTPPNITTQASSRSKISVLRENPMFKRKKLRD